MRRTCTEYRSRAAKYTAHPILAEVGSTCPQSASEGHRASYRCICSQETPSRWRSLFAERWGPLTDLHHEACKMAKDSWKILYRQAQTPCFPWRLCYCCALSQRHLLSFHCMRAHKDSGHNPGISVPGYQMQPWEDQSVGLPWPHHSSTIASCSCRRHANTHCSLWTPVCRDGHVHKSHRRCTHAGGARASSCADAPLIGR